LTRADVQYDLLHHIFGNTEKVFTDPLPEPGRPLAKITFAQLYISSLFNSSKCSKVLKDKMTETPEFAVELAKFSLLTNVGRINTTMACTHYFTRRMSKGALTAGLGSFSRDEDCLTNLPPSSFSTKDGWECSRRSSYQKLPQSRTPRV
jgi:hypothetical protein